MLFAITILLLVQIAPVNTLSTKLIARKAHEHAHTAVAFFFAQLGPDSVTSHFC